MTHPYTHRSNRKLAYKMGLNRRSNITKLKRRFIPDPRSSPLCMFLGINHTDYIKSITSFSTKPGLGLHACMAKRNGMKYTDIQQHTFPNGRCRHFDTPNRFRGSNKLIARYHSPAAPFSQLRSPGTNGI